MRFELFCVFKYYESKILTASRLAYKYYIYMLLMLKWIKIFLNKLYMK